MTRAKLLLITALRAVCACNGNGTDTPGDIPEDPQPVFARGADASWVTEMEAAGKSFYDANGQKTECFALLKSLGFNAIRLYNTSDKFHHLYASARLPLMTYPVSCPHMNDGRFDGAGTTLYCIHSILLARLYV